MKFGINVLKGAVVGSVQEVKGVLNNVFPSEKEIVVKSQILAGGRGLGSFKSGLKGGVHIVKAEEAEGLAGSGNKTNWSRGESFGQDNLHQPAAALSKKLQEAEEARLRQEEFAG